MRKGDWVVLFFQILCVLALYKVLGLMATFVGVN